VSPEGFIKALDHHGYMLAIGRRPVVIDIHGTEHSLARLINLKEAGVKEVHEYLGEHYNLDDLPSVEEAKELVDAHIVKTKIFERKEDHAEQIETLEAGQNARREKLKAEIAVTLEHHRADRTWAEGVATDERRDHRRAFLEQRREIKAARKEAKPTGLAAFLGRVTGVALIQRKIHKRQDRQRYGEHLDAKQEITQRQYQDSEEMRLSHQMRALDATRQRRELSYRDAQEIRSLETHFEKQARLLARSIEPAPTPAPQLELTPFGRRAVPLKAMGRYTGSSYKDRATKDEFHTRASNDKEDKLSPTRVEPKNRDAETPKLSVTPKPIRIDKTIATGKETLPSMSDVRVGVASPPNENLRDARKRGVVVPQVGGLSSRFEEAARIENELEGRSSAGEGSQTRTPMHHVKSETPQVNQEPLDAPFIKEADGSQLAKLLPRPGLLSDHAAIVSRGGESDQLRHIKPGGQVDNHESDIEQPRGPEEPSDELDYEHDR